MIQGVLFDLFETLVTESRSSSQRASALAAELGLKNEAYRRLWRPRRREIVLGRCSFRDTLAQIVRSLGGTPDMGLIERLRARRVDEKAAVLRAVEGDVIAALGLLQTNGLKLGLVTNSFAEDVAGWEGSPLHPWFDVAVFSCATGLAKPDPEIYRTACRTLRVPPEHTLYVGDGGDDELTGARSAGLHAARALWYVSRWPGANITPTEPGLRQPAEVMQAAVA